MRSFNFYDVSFFSVYMALRSHKVYHQYRSHWFPSGSGLYIPDLMTNRIVNLYFATSGSTNSRKKYRKNTHVYTKYEFKYNMLISLTAHCDNVTHIILSLDEYLSRKRSFLLQVSS